jgi:3-phenylpropionate/trans-cinnamate dioxygenase ferredoxin reductase component
MSNGRDQRVDSQSGMTPRSVLIVGAGLAGTRCAETLRAEGYDGDLVIVGEEDVPPYERPALSKEFLAGKRTTADLLLRPLSYWPEHAIDLRLGSRITRVDTAERLATAEDGGTYAWDALVLATGARPRLLPFAAPPGVHVLRTLADARGLRAQLRSGKRLVIIGGGFVGAEVASTARDTGVEVTLIEAGDAPFERVLGRDLGMLLCSRYRQHGVEVKTRTTVSSFVTGAGGRIAGVRLADGSQVECDVALVSVGVEPAPMPVTHPAPSVFACGDALGGPGHWTSAAASGIAVARKLIGLDALPVPPPFFWSDQFGLRIQLVGTPTRAATIELAGNEADFVVRYLGHDGRLVGGLAANRPDVVAGFRRELALAV